VNTWQGSRAVRRLGLAFALVVLASGCDWTALGFGPANTNFNPFEPALTESSVQHLEEAWSAPCACTGALVAGGLVYVIDGYSGTQPYSLKLRAFDATNGALTWSRPLGTSQFGHVLSAVANGLVYVIVRPETGSDRIVAVDAATGVVRWRLTPPEPGSGPVRIFGLIVDGPTAFATAGPATRSDIFAIDSRGHVVWSAAPGGFVSALTADPGHRIVYTASFLQLTSAPSIQLLTGYAEGDGTTRSAVVVPVPPFSLISSLGFSNDLIFGSQLNDHGEGGVGAFAVHPGTGELAWSGDGNVAAITPSAVLDFHLRADLNTIARNPSTGAVLWQASTSTAVEAVAGDLVYVLNGDIDIRRISNGSIVATIPVSPTDPFRALIPSAGRVYVVTNAHLTALAPA
jgi:outer membrane protein assembly factor BamB